ERLWAVGLAVRLRDRAEELHPVLAVVELVGVVQDVPHLVPQVAQDVRAAEALDVADLLAVELGQLRPREIERDANRDGAERHAPFSREIEARRDLRDAACGELRAELLDDRSEPHAVDRVSEIAHRRAEEVRLAEAVRHGAQWYRLGAPGGPGGG